MILIPILIVIMVGCGGSKDQQQSGKQQSDQQNDAPEQLVSLENNIEKIIAQLNGPAIKAKDTQSSQKEQNTSQKNTQQQSGGSSSGGESESSDSSNDKNDKGNGQDQKQNQNQNKQGSGQGSQQQSQQDPMTKIVSTANNIHYQWNDLMPVVVKKGAGRTVMDGFSNEVNNLTTAIISKNKNQILWSANRLYSYIPDLYSLYKGKTSPEIKRVRYYTRNAMLNAMNANWPQAQQDMANLKSCWDIYKRSTDKEQQSTINKAEFSISELERVILDKNQPLVDIKGRIMLSNLKEIENPSQSGGAQSEQSQSGSSQSGSSQSGSSQPGSSQQSGESQSNGT